MAGFCFQDGEREEGFLRSNFDVSCTKAVIVALGVWFWERDLLLYQSWNASLGLGPGKGWHPKRTDSSQQPQVGAG